MENMENMEHLFREQEMREMEKATGRPAFTERFVLEKAKIKHYSHLIIRHPQ